MTFAFLVQGAFHVEFGIDAARSGASVAHEKDIEVPAAWVGEEGDPLGRGRISAGRRSASSPVRRLVSGSCVGRWNYLVIVVRVVQSCAHPKVDGAGKGEVAQRAAFPVEAGSGGSCQSWL